MNSAASITPLLLPQASYLLELEVDRPCPEDALLDGLSEAFANVTPDESSSHSSSRPRSGAASAARARRKGVPELVRFVARADSPLTLQDREDARWAYIRKLAIDPFAELRYKLEAFALETGMEYEVRFLSRMRAQPTRPIVEDDLREMGWEPIKLSALKRDMRIPGRSGASVTLWLGILRWTGPASYITEEDPFYFEDAVPASAFSHQPTAVSQSENESESESETPKLPHPDDMHGACDEFGGSDFP